MERYRHTGGEPLDWRQFVNKADKDLAVLTTGCYWKGTLTALSEQEKEHVMNLYQSIKKPISLSKESEGTQFGSSNITTFKKKEEVIKSSAIEDESLDLSHPAQVFGREKPVLPEPLPESLPHHPSDSELPKKVFSPESRTERVTPNLAMPIAEQYRSLDKSIEKPPFPSAKEAGYALRKKRESQANVYYIETEKEKRQSVKQQEIQKKRELREWKLDLASFRALKKIRDSEDKFKSSKDISDEEKIDVINKTATFVHDIFEACQNSVPFEEALRLRVKALVISAEVEQLLLKHPEIRQRILESHRRVMGGDETEYVGIEEMEKILEENRPQGRTLSGTYTLDSV